MNRLETGKKRLLEARRKKIGLSMADIVQTELRNEDITPDIRELINSCSPSSRGWGKQKEKENGS